MIPFHKAYITGKEENCIRDAILSRRLAGNGKYTAECQDFFQKHLQVPRTLLTTSCTDALEMASLLINIQPGDEIICPSYSFVSSALAFVRQGARIRFVDSRADHPGMDEEKIIELLSPKTKAIVVVHYAGVACNMARIMDLAKTHKLIVVEDAAQCIGASYKSEDGITQKLGTISHLGAMSFHETKNIHCGEGGLLIIQDAQFIERAEIIWEKGTNRTAFFQGQVDKYGWVDTGSSFLPSELNAAFLYAQLQQLEQIQQRRSEIWQYYYQNIRGWAEGLGVSLPGVPDYANHNSHLFYLVFPSQEMRNLFMKYLSGAGIQTTFHYQSLHNSSYYKPLYEGIPLPEAEKYSNCLVRLPLYPDLKSEEQQYIVEKIILFTP